MEKQIRFDSNAVFCNIRTEWVQAATMAAEEIAKAPAETLYPSLPRSLSLALSRARSTLGR